LLLQQYKKDRVNNREGKKTMAITRRELISTGLVGGTGLFLTNGCAQSPLDATQTRATSTLTSSPIKLQIVIFDGFEIMDALGPLDALTIARHFATQLETTLVTLDDATEVVTLNGVSVKPTSRFDSSADLLLIPGTGLRWQTVHPQGLTETLQHWHSAGKTITSVCTGAMLVAQSGLLKGRNVTTHSTAIDALQKTGARTINARVVDDGDIITAGGVTCGLDLALYLVERYFGSQAAISTEQVMEYERRGVVWRSHT
jgi:transcriptional regulator GlxA family with amidase domain